MSETILCLASEHKGVPFIEEAKRQGCRVLLLVAEEHADKPWPWHLIDAHYRMPDLAVHEHVRNAVSYLMRSEPISRVVALDDYDVATAAMLREHLRLGGMGETQVRFFRDKLAMRQQAQENGILVPPFTAVFNYDTLRHFMATVPAPWVLKPRHEAGGVGIQKMDHSEAVWRKLDELGDQQSFFLLEQFVPGDVYHVDTITWDGQQLFTIASKYGTPPLSVVRGGGIFITRILDRSGDEAQALQGHVAALLRVLGMERGVNHTEFIRAGDNYYFLETAARVGGANIDKMVKAATGIELWAEAARTEIAHLRGQAYHLPDHRQDYAGLITCLSRQEWPNMNSYSDPEVKWQLPKEYHAGLLLASPDAQRVEHLLTDYSNRFAHDFLIHTPDNKQARTTI